MSNSESALNIVGATYTFLVSSSDPNAVNLAPDSVINITTNVTSLAPYGDTISYIPSINSAFRVKLGKPILLSQPDKFQIVVSSCTFQPPLDYNGYESPLYIYSNVVMPTTFGSSQYNLLGDVPPPVGGVAAGSYPQIYTNVAVVPNFLPIGSREINEITIELTDIGGNLIPANPTDIVTQTPNSPPSSWTTPQYPTFVNTTNLSIVIRRIAPDD